MYACIKCGWPVNSKPGILCKGCKSEGAENE